ncbi:MAG: TIGR01777 family protein [Luteitalea sp.]|nr:TIGR01777 family protein [Luteitalea sp.]
MNIVISGATGFLGRPLSAALAASGHHVTALSRATSNATTAGAWSNTIAWTPDGSANGSWAAVVDGADVVINLAGESIAGRRWTAARKRQILDSRVLATRSLTEAVTRSAKPPAVFVSGSAVGFYGPLQDQIVTEDTPAGRDFLSGVCVRWEDEARRLEGGRTRVVCVRTGIVLERDGGALPQMLPPFWFGAGGPVGSGRQYWPWIHRDDWIGLLQFVIDTPAATGPVNATAPNPVTNRDFARALGRALHRPAFMPAPGFALKLLLGEMADALLLSGQRAVPAKAQRLGYTFRYKTVDDALRAIFKH